MYQPSQNNQTILLAIGSSEMGGAQKIFLTIINELIKRNYHLIVVLPDGPLYQILQSYNLEINKTNFNSLNYIFTIAKLLKKNNVNLIHTHLTKCSLIISIINLFFRYPICCTLHNAIIHEKLNEIQKKSYPFFYNYLSKISNGLIVNSIENKEHFIKVAKIKPESIRLIYNGIDIDEFPISGIQISKNCAFQIGFIGRLSIEKGLPYLIEALTYLSEINFECVIVGDGPLRDECEEMVKKYNLTNKVKFLGYQNNVIPFLSIMDVLVIPSINDVCPLSILEAFALKKNVIASNVGGIPELVKNRQTGLLFQQRDISDLAEKIQYLYNNKEEAQAMRLFAFEEYHRRYTSSIMIENTIKYYDDIISIH